MSGIHRRALLVLCLAIYFYCRGVCAAVLDGADINPLIAWNNQAVGEIAALTTEIVKLTEEITNNKELQKAELSEMSCFVSLNRRLSVLQDPVEKAIILGLLARQMSSSDDESALLGTIAAQISRFTKAQTDSSFMTAAPLSSCSSVNGQNHYRTAMQLVGKLNPAAAPLVAKICNRDGNRC